MMENTYMESLQQEIEKRRTFAIISHPDAGKTTLTEKFLLYGGAINLAGSVKGKATARHAVSDWMEIEKQRGISVTSSVLQFNYDNYCINILDTPGHQDFSEDTYRTLMAADSAVMVIDASKGVEAQTRKLFKVCAMRHIPIFTFINKMDRDALDTFELLDNVEKELGIETTPINWPIGSGKGFKGVYDVEKKTVLTFADTEKGTKEGTYEELSDPERIAEYIGKEAQENLSEELELLSGAGAAFDLEEVRAGRLTPVFFGSALNNFGVQELLNCFVEIAPSPRPTKAEERDVQPEEKKFTGFIFKITANIDPNHRSCTAFCKVCSGRFVRNAPYLHVRNGKTVRFSSPTQFMAQKKSTIDEAWAGDIVGLPDNGIFKIGDTLTEGEQLHFKGLPSFSPEMFKYIENADPMKTKQLEKGINQLMDEGVAQMFINQFNGRKLIGTVGQLQFEVIQYRLENEYNAKCRWEPVSLYKACWVESDDEAELEAFKKRKYQYMAKDKDGRDVFLADSNYVLQMAQQDFKNIKFHFNSDF